MDKFTHEKLKYWIALQQASGIGPVACQAILAKFPSLQEFFCENRDSLLRLGLKEHTIDAILSPDWEQVEQAISWAEQGADRHILTFDDPNYPVLLRQSADPPILLYAHGQLTCLADTKLAMVGSRNPTNAGRRLAGEFSEVFARLGLTITSGMAFGIDYCSHIGALKGGGHTVVVTGSGPDVVYPAQHREFVEDLVLEKRGIVLTEFPPGTKPLPGHFPRRNRIISGLSVGVLVVEANIKSGSLITARFAIEQNREVFAIPGSIHSPQSKGCHQLIKQGAKLVECTEDVLGEIGHLIAPVDLHSTPSGQVIGADELDSDYQNLLAMMGYESVSIDHLVALGGFSTKEVSSMLLILELRGIIEYEPGGTYIRIV